MQKNSKHYWRKSVTLGGTNIIPNIGYASRRRTIRQNERTRRAPTKIRHKHNRPHMPNRGGLVRSGIETLHETNDGHDNVLALFSFGTSARAHCMRSTWQEVNIAHKQTLPPNAHLFREHCLAMRLVSYDSTRTVGVQFSVAPPWYLPDPPERSKRNGFPSCDGGLEGTHWF